MSDEQRKAVLTGGCQCGAVRYALYAEPTEPGICHCRMCQKAFGNYFSALAGVPPRNLAWTRGQLSVFRSSEAVERGFCRDCGTPLSYHVVGSDRISVSLGSLDEPRRVWPTVQDGVEGRVWSLADLDALPAETTEASIPPDMLARMRSRQHPDRD